jgi:hypothetical protein
VLWGDLDLRATRSERAYRQMAPVLDERSRRRFAAVEALSLGHGWGRPSRTCGRYPVHATLGRNTPPGIEARPGFDRGLIG